MTKKLKTSSDKRTTAGANPGKKEGDKMKAILMDSYDILEEREIENLIQLEELNRQAKEATDGNLHWVVNQASRGQYRRERREMSMLDLKELSREELIALKEQIEALLAQTQENKLQVELEYNRYKGTGKCWAARVDPDTRKILGFVDAESVVATDRNKGYKVFLLPDGHYLLCETGSKSQDSRNYVQVEAGESRPF
jgi:hypothetical protein